MTIKQFAAARGISEEAVRARLRKGTLAKSASGHIDLASDLTRFRSPSKAKKAADTPSDSAEDSDATGSYSSERALLDARVKKVQRDSELVQIRIEKEKAALVRTDAVCRAWGAAGRLLRSRMLALGSRLATIAAANKAADIVALEALFDVEIRAALRSLPDNAPGVETDQGDSNE